MKIRILRQKETDKATMGRIIAEAPNGNKIEVFCLELPWRDNQPNISCITPDTYKARIEYHPRFKQDVIRLEDKHGRTGILIHQGNWPHQIQGCILPGLSTGEDAVWESVKALQLLTGFCKANIDDVGQFGALQVVVAGLV